MPKPDVPRNSPLAGLPAPASVLIDVPKLITAYYEDRPDPALASQRVAFGTSGHRGSAFDRSFNEWHVLAIAQALCDHRHAKGITGPYMDAPGLPSFQLMTARR